MKYIEIFDGCLIAMPDGQSNISKLQRERSPIHHGAERRNGAMWEADYAYHPVFDTGTLINYYLSDLDEHGSGYKFSQAGILYPEDNGTWFREDLEAARHVDLKMLFCQFAFEAPDRVVRKASELHLRHTTVGCFDFQNEVFRYVDPYGNPLPDPLLVHVRDVFPEFSIQHFTRQQVFASSDAGPIAVDNLLRLGAGQAPFNPLQAVAKSYRSEEERQWAIMRAADNYIYELRHAQKDAILCAESALKAPAPLAETFASTPENGANQMEERIALSDTMVLVRG